MSLASMHELEVFVSIEVVAAAKLNSVFDKEVLASFEMVACSEAS